MHEQLENHTIVKSQVNLYKKTGGLLRRDVSMQKEETDKKMQPFDEVLDAFKQVQEARRNLM